ncbi:MAG: hypothetical protein D6677_11150 [Calditrichaeota bacterium]|nr:MAG: hypothetical protein D6677_11150 [Calditrichota bacterium]
MKIKITLLSVLLAFSGLQAQNVKSDSLFKKVSIDELIKIRKYFNRKVDRLRSEEAQSLTEGKKLGESFLTDEGIKIKDRDKIYIRIAEYYIEEADRDQEKAYEEYSKKEDAYLEALEKFDAGELDTEPVPPEEPKLDYSKAIKIYDKLLNEYPASEFADDALYSKAWLLAQMGEGAKSRRLFQEVIDKYPDSRFAPESYIQLAEYFFRPRPDKTDENQVVLELRKAIQLYKKVLGYRNSRRYDEALYKLGWSYYKLASRDPKYYNDAIVYFVAVADDIDRARKLDPKNKISTPNVRDEAITYIGISFTDESYTKQGVDKARKMVERLGDRPYGVEIMRAIGDTYQKIDEQEKAIYAFQTLLEMFPDYVEAPVIQKKIAQALYAKGRDQEAYDAREKLYQNYGPQSEWYANLENSDRKDRGKYLRKAYKLSEEAFRANLIADLEDAQAKDAEGITQARPAWQKFADECKLYLDVFPSDSNTYEIHWNYAKALDQKLGDFEEAFEQYLSVSNDYLEENHQHDAALYAVGVADTIVKIKYGSQGDSVKFNLADIAQLNPETLSPEETNLIQAYDNYIRLFPNGKYTPNFLAAAGGIYYNHKKFAEAKIYFQTLVRRFPGAREKSLAMRSIMDSYFALGKFKDSEVIAKKILADSTLPDDQRKFASQRLAEAIFKNAEFLAEQGDFFAAANEYLRLYKEVPDDKRYVEPALWNAGLNYQKARDWIRSNEVFAIIADKFPESQFAYDALNNMVENYKELEQYANAAQVSERIFNTYPKKEDAESKLYNASYFYQKAGEWAEAIRVNNIYINTYPNLEYAKDLFFKNADLYLKLDNLAEANRIYDEFAKRYPNDSRVITAFYERGKYYLDNGQKEAAKIEFNKAIAKSEEFKRAGKDYNPFIAGEAVNKLADILHDEYVSIRLTLPESNIKAQQEKMKTLLKELNTAYTKVLAFGSPRSFEATFNIARSFEEFANAYAQQEVDPNLDPTKYFVKKKTINEQAAALYENAVDRYKDVIEKIPVIAEKLNVDMFGQDTAQTAIIDSADVRREAEQDSTKELALKWYDKAHDKISQLLYTEASLTSENVDNIRDLKPPVKDAFSTILYQAGVINKVVAPAVQQTIKAHIRNVNEADELKLSNKYVEESKRQILLTSNILADEYVQLTEAALDEFERNFDEYQQLIEKEFGTKNAEGLDYYGLENNALQMVDLSIQMANNAMDAFANTLELARENNVENDLLRSTQDRLIKFALESAGRMKVLADSSNKVSQRYQAFFDSTKNYNYQDGLSATESFFFALDENSLALLEKAFEIKTDHEIKGSWANRLMLKLLEIDPAQYSESIDKEKVEIFSDTSWKVTNNDFGASWVEKDFDDSGWDFAQVVPSGFNQFDSLGVNPQAIWYVITTTTTAGDTTRDTLQVGLPSADSTTVAAVDSNMTDTLAVTVADTNATVAATADSNAVQPVPTLGAAVVNDTLVFFRKDFTIDGKVVDGRIYVTADNDFRIYLNGEYLLDDPDDDLMVLDSLDFYTFDRFISNGTNIIAIDVIDKDKTQAGLKLYAYFEVIPSEFLKANEDKKIVEKIALPPEKLVQLNIVKKNRIIPGQ